MVASVDKADNSFVGNFDFPVGGAVEQWTFSYDSNDVFIVKGLVTDLDGFEAAVSETDVATVEYKDTASPVSTFEITTDNTASATLKVTDPAAAKAIDSANYTIKGTGEVGATIRIYADTDNDGLANEALLGSSTVLSSGIWSVTVPLTQNAANDFVAWQRVSVGDTPSLAMCRRSPRCAGRGHGCTSGVFEQLAGGPVQR